MDTIGVGDLLDTESERRLHTSDAPDACHEPEQFKIIERSHDALFATPRQMGEALHRGENFAVLLREIRHMKLHCSGQWAVGA
jgi:hypothetical protein